MTLEVLCEPTFPSKESAALHETANMLGMTTEDFIRAAVKNYVAQCVPTQKPETKAEIVLGKICVPTH